jgi:hypothetical protein
VSLTHSVSNSCAYTWRISPAKKEITSKANSQNHPKTTNTPQATSETNPKQKITPKANRQNSKLAKQKNTPKKKSPQMKKINPGIPTGGQHHTYHRHLQKPWAEPISFCCNFNPNPNPLNSYDCEGS